MHPSSSSRRFARLSLIVATVVATSLSLFAQAPQVPSFVNVTVHDPSVVAVGSEYYVFGSHLASARTSDWLHWSQISSEPVVGNPLFPNPGQELQDALAWTGAGGAYWAPDVIKLRDGRYYFYYCIGRLDAPRAALGIAVADSVGGPYRNLGIILRSGMWGLPSEDGTIYDPTKHPNTVDPDVFFDREGKLWMVYGSYSGGIFIMRLDPATGFPLPGQGYGKKLIGGNHSRIEGAFMLYSPESHYYYMFLSFGGLDANGGYNIRMARSRTPDGPFRDAAGNDLTSVAGAPGTLFDDLSIAPFGVKLMGNYQFVPAPGEPATVTRGYVSPGHNSAYYDPKTGKHFLVFHTRFVGRGEEHQVRVHQLVMNADEWLVAAPHRYAGEDLEDFRRKDVKGDYKLINHGKAISPAVNTSSIITLNPNRTVSGAVSGTWQLSNDYDLTLTLGGTTYRGVFVKQWDDDNAAWVQAFSALSANGVSLWGSQTVVSKKSPRTVSLKNQVALYGSTLRITLPEPKPNPKKVYSYRVLNGPSGVNVDRASGVLTWKPMLWQVGNSQSVTILALHTEDDHEQTLYTFSLTAASPTVVRRVDLNFSTAASLGIRDRDGRLTGLTTRLPGTGTALGQQDPLLFLDTAAGSLKLTTTQADFVGRAGLSANSAPGVALAELGYTGTEDFAVTATFRALPGIEFIDQVGLLVGTSSDSQTRAGTIVFGAPERYSTHSENGVDRNGRFFGFGLNASDGMTVIIMRESGVWRYFVDGLEWNPQSPTTFLDGRADLVAALFALTPLNNNPKAIEVDAFSVLVATKQPAPVVTR